MTTDTLANGLKAVFGSTNNIQSSSLIPYADSSRNPAGFTDMSKLASVLGDKNYCHYFYFGGGFDSTAGVKIKVDAVPYNASIHIGHPMSHGVIDLAVRTRTGVNNGKPYDSLIKARIGIDPATISAKYYQQNGYNYFEVLSSDAAYAGITVVIYGTNDIISVEQINQFSVATGDATVTIS